MLWACALPDTVAVIAALTLPDMLADGGDAAALAPVSEAARAAAAGAAPQLATDPLPASLPEAQPAEARRVFRFPLTDAPTQSESALASEGVAPDLAAAPQMLAASLLAMPPAAREDALPVPVEAPLLSCSESHRLKLEIINSA